MTEAEVNRGSHASAPPSAEPPAALVLSGSRRTRRDLFDLLDRAGCRVALSAKGIPQARRCLDKDPGIRLLVVDASAADSEFGDFCRELRAGGVHSAIAVVGVASGTDQSSTGSGEQGPREAFDELLSMELDESELLGRLNRLMERTAHVASRAAGSGVTAQAIDSILDVLPDAAALLDTAEMRILSVNPRFHGVAGLDEDGAAGLHFFDLDHGHDAQQVAELKSVLKRDGALKFLLRLDGDSAGTGSVDATLQLVALDDEPRYLVTLRDPGPVRHIEQCLGLVCESFSSLLDDERLHKLLQQHVAWLGLDFLFVARRSEREGQLDVLALHASQPMHDTIVSMPESETLARVERGEELILQSSAWRRGNGDPLVAKHRVESFIGLPLLDANREVIGVLAAGVARGHLPHWGHAVTMLRILAGRVGLDMALRRYQSDTRTQGLYDPLTRLPNRLLFEDRLRGALGEARRTGEQFAVLFVDLDRFRTLNDNYGHDIGDRVLRDVARRLGASVRASDTVSRYASDCFLMILRHVIQKEDVARIVRKLCESLGRRLDLAPGSAIELTASIGASFYPHDGTTAEELVRHAEQAMQSAKSLGRNTYQTYVGEPAESRQQKLVLESKLQHAEQNKELRVYYQPQVSAESEDIVGMEALMRWEHPDLGLVSPGAFIPLAEETGLIVPMGEWLLREACRQAREWRDRYGLALRLGVNLSALQLKQPDIVKVVGSVLSETGLDPALLELEVTESISIKDVRNLLHILNDFRQLGCSISIDDFGTGQSSLDYIKRFPADRIKIDQVFVRNIGVDPDDAAIVEATINMAHNLKRSVVAEGVEEEPQLEFLRRNGCEELQGFLFSRPLPAGSFERLLQERQRLMAARQHGSA